MEFVQPIRDRKLVESMKKVLRGGSLRDYCLFVVGINSGLRVSDLLALHVADVLDETGVIRDRITLREKKTSKYKDFPIGDSTRKALKEYLASYHATPTSPLFPSRKGGTAITRQHAYRILNDAAQAVGITDPLGTHSMRKTFGY